MTSRMKNKPRNSSNDHGECGLEEMKKQLTELGMYEEGMSLVEMKDTLTVVDNSKLSVERNSIEFSSPPNLDKVLESPHSLFSSIDNYVHKQTKNEDSNSKPISDHSNRLHPLSTEAESNIELHRNKITEKSSSYRRSSNSVKNSELEFPDLTESHELKTSDSVNNMEDDCRLNLSSCKKLDHGMPLKLKCLPSIRQKFTMIDGISYVFNATLDQQCATLNEMAMIWHNYNIKSKSNEIQWGSPIKVEIANGSLDKKPYSPPDEDQEVLELQNVERTPTQISLRPRLVPKYNFDIDDDDNDNNNNDDDDDNDDYDYDDDDDDDIEPIFQKRKKISTSIQKPPIKKRNVNKTKKRQSQESGTEEENHLISKTSLKSKVQLLNPRKRSAKSPTPEYPELSHLKKNIVPSQTSSLLNSTNDALNNHQSIKQSTFLPNDQKEKSNRISKSLNSIEIESILTDDEDEEVIPNSQESEKCTDRLKKSNKLLQQSIIHEDKKRQETEEWQKLCIKNDERDKQDRLQRRLEEEAAISLKREEEEKKEQEQKNKYRNVAIRSKKRFNTRNELNAEELQNKHTIVVNSDEESSMMVKEETNSDENNSTGYANENVECPLCNKYFTPNKIESHADECASISDNIQQQGSQNEGNIEVSGVLPSKTLMTCQSCKNFSTNDCKDFEQHCSYECEDNFDDRGTVSNKKVTTSMIVQPTLPTSDNSSRKRKR